MKQVDLKSLIYEYFNYLPALNVSMKKFEHTFIHIKEYNCATKIYEKLTL